MGDAAPDEDCVIERQELVARATHSVKWSFISNIAPRLVTPITTLWLTTLLTPADFGIVAASTTVLALAQIVLGLGMGAAVIQRRTDVQGAASTALWMTLVLAAGLYGLVWISAPYVAQLYNMPVIAGALRVAALALVITGAGSIPGALIQRNLDFQKLFWVNSIAPVISGLVSVGLVLGGAGFWGLIWGPLAGAGVGTLLAWRLAGWRPAFAFDRYIARSLVGFGAWVVAASMVTWFFGQADNALCGYTYGTATLGVYALGFNLSGLFPGFVISPLAAVAYPAFCAVQHDAYQVGRALLKLQALTAAVLCPVALGLAAIAYAGVAAIYGGRWPGLGMVIQFLAIMPGLSHIWSLNADAYRALGRPDIWPRLGLVTLLVLMPLLVMALPHGLLWFTVARMAGATVFPVLIILMTPSVLHITVREQLRAIAGPLTCAVVMFLVARLCIGRLDPFVGWQGLVKLGVVIAASAAVYVGLLWLVSREAWNDLLAAARRILVGAAWPHETKRSND